MSLFLNYGRLRLHFRPASLYSAVLCCWHYVCLGGSSCGWLRLAWSPFNQSNWTNSFSTMNPFVLNEREEFLTLRKCQCLSTSNPHRWDAHRKEETSDVGKAVEIYFMFVVQNKKVASWSICKANVDSDSMVHVVTQVRQLSAKSKKTKQKDLGDIRFFFLLECIFYKYQNLVSYNDGSYSSTFAVRANDWRTDLHFNATFLYWKQLFRRFQ